MVVLAFLLGLEMILLTGKGKYQCRSCLAWGEKLGSYLKAGGSQKRLVGGGVGGGGVYGAVQGR